MFDSLTFNVQQGEIVGIVGDSGCGKSSLGDAILGHLKVFSGEIVRQKHRVKRSGLSYIKIHLLRFLSISSRKKMLDDLIALHKLDASRVAPLMKNSLCVSRCFICNSSQYQVVSFSASILRALLMEPVFLFADEPTSRLDPIIAKEVTMQLVQLAREQNCSLLIVSHDPDLINAIADKVINISDYAPPSGKFAGVYCLAFISFQKKDKSRCALVLFYLDCE